MTSQRQSSRRRPGHVDLGRLHVGTLRKYGNHFNLEEASNGSSGSKEDLLPAVAKHFSSQVINDEQDTLFQFLVSLRKRKLLDNPSLGSALATPGAKKVARTNKRGNK